MSVYPLHDAVLREDTRTVRDLLRIWAAVNLEVGNYGTPLHLAAKTSNFEIVRLLLNAGAYVNACLQTSGETPLHFAVHNSDREVILTLLDRGADINAKTMTSGETPLHIAVLNSNRELIFTLLYQGADVNAKTKTSGETPLHLAVHNGENEAVLALLDRGADVNAKTTTSGETPLHFAVHNSDREVILTLLDRGADINAKTMTSGETPLHIAVLNSNRELIFTLLYQGADVNAKTKTSGETPLHLAVHNGENEAVLALVDRGADVNAKTTTSGETPLHFAVHNSDREVILTLLDRGADINAKTMTSGETPLHIAVLNSNRELIFTLLYQGADVNAKTKTSGETPLHLAVHNGENEAVLALLDRGADVNAKTTIMQTSGETLLHIAFHNCNSEVILALLDRGANVNAKTTTSGETPLHIAVHNGNNEVILALIDRGADVNAKTTIMQTSGETLLHIAFHNCNSEVILALLDRGADVNAKTTTSGETPLHIAVHNGNNEVILALIDRGAEVNAKTTNGDTPIDFAAKKGHGNVLFTLLKAGGECEIFGKTSEIATGEAKELLNALQKVPKEIQQFGTQCILQYYQASLRGTFPTNFIRCMFVGHFGVGKTTLVKRIIGERDAVITSTNGIDVYLGRCFFNKKAKNWRVRAPDKNYESVQCVEDIIQIDIWDFAGQLIFYTTHHTFLSRRCLYFLVFDLSMGLYGKVMDDDLDPISCQHRNVIDFMHFWIGSIRLYAKGERREFPKIVIIGTHKDKVQNSKQLDDILKEIQERFSDLITAGQLIVREDLFINALQMDDDITDLLREAIVDIGEQYPEFGEEIPLSWMKLHDHIYRMKGRGRKVINRDELEEINAKMDDPLGEEELNLFLMFLHSIGYILYFNDAPLRNTIILDPSWIIDAMKCLVTCKQFLYRLWNEKQWKKMRETGKVEKVYIEKVWKRQKSGPLYQNREHLLLVMEKLDLICKPKIYDQQGNVIMTNFYYVPCMVNTDFPEEMKAVPTNENISLTYCLPDVLPPALFNRLVSSCLCLWQVHKRNLYNGVVELQSGKNHLLRLTRDYQSINVTILHTRPPSAEQPQIIDANIFRAIRRFLLQTIQRILETYSIDTSNVCQLECSQSAHFLLGVDNSVAESSYGTCEEGCAGLTEAEEVMELTDKHLMYLACRIRQEEHLMRLSATLFEYSQAFEDIKKNNKELEFTDYAFLLLHKWKSAILGRRSVPNGAMLRDQLKDADLNIHALCKAIRQRDREATQLDPVYQMKVPTPELLDAVADRLSRTYFQIGVELGFHLEEIERFRMNNRGNTLEIIREMLHTWLARSKKDSKATVAWLATALLNTQSNVEKLIELEDISLPAPEKEQREGERKCSVM